MAPIRTGPREVVLTPDWMGFGNVAYLWLWAHLEQAAGRDARVLETVGMAPWREAFPNLAGLGVAASDIAFRDRRRSAVAVDYGTFGVNFTADELGDFIRTRLLSSPLFAQATSSDEDVLVVNVRRGDYYSVPEFRGQFGFDVDAYLDVAVTASVEADGRPDRIHVVSDGFDWCRARLGWLSDHAPLVTYADPADGPRHNLTEVSSAKRLVLANSTFSYWCGYISTVLHPEDAAKVWAPSFFGRTARGYRSWHLNPQWSVVEDIPGGWDS